MVKDTKLLVASTEPVDLDEDTTTTPAAAPAETEAVSEPETKPGTEEVVAEETKPAVPEKETKSETEDAPPQPPRPLSPAARIKKDLKEAFPQIEDKYIEAVLIASHGRSDPAFNALLYLLDPTFKPEPYAVAEVSKAPVSATDDELLARQLQKEFEREDRRRRSQQRRKHVPAPSDDSPDEFDQLKEQFSQGFEEAKSTLNSWVSGISKKLSGDDEQKKNPKLFGALGGSSFNNNAKTTKFDEDPEILALDFRRNVDLKDENPPLLPKRDKHEEKWQPLNLDVPVTLDAFLVTDSEDEDKK